MLVVRNKKSPQSCYDGRWNNQYAFHPLLMNDLHRFFGSDEHAQIPKVNISENENGYTIELAVPGVAKEDLHIQIEKDLLTISSEVKKTSSKNAADNSDNINETEEKSHKFLKKEFNYYGFKRSFKIPENGDLNGITASYLNGILTVVLTKKQATNEAGSKTISIS